ncbi:MAG: aminotransferase class V-fold PLP-dependent enzyme, partial [Defluviitaleaceae bacterium]|nr:aminotransferase class V-fold PLP-dependent enzyme [Defluviitaleaceae bacterium]
GSGSNSAARTQPNTMPDIFEAGTANTPGIYGLLHGVQFINNVGINTIHSREMELLRGFYNGIKNNSKITIYGNFDNDNRLPIISINAEGISAADFSARLWDDFAIATRAGSHCAPLLHKHFGTDKIGMLRFSFSHYNTPEEIEFGINAVNTIVGG